MSVSCRAKNPATCRVHGSPVVPDGIRQNDFNRYLQFREHAEWVDYDRLPKQARLAAETYFEQMQQEQLAGQNEVVSDYQYELRLESVDEFIGRYCEGDFADGYEAHEFAEHHAGVLGHVTIPGYRQGQRWPVIVDDSNPNYIDDGFHRFHAYYAAGDQVIPTMRMRYNPQTR